MFRFRGWVGPCLALVGLASVGEACRQNPEAAPVAEQGLGPAGSLHYDRALAGLAERDSFNGSVLVALPDTVFEQSYRAKGAPESMYTASNFRYPIGEVGQLLLRAAYFRLADQGRLQLNAAVAEYLPDLPEAGRINYRMLLDHRAGLPDVLPKGALDVSDLTLIDVPGANEHYSSLGYHLLAAALSRILRTPIETVIRTSVLEPAEMSNTGVFNPAAPVGNLAMGHTQNGSSLVDVPLAEWPRLFETRDARGPLTGMPEYYSTITDLFYLAQWMPESGYLRGALQQPGVRPGYRSYFYAALEPAFATVILSNLESVSMPVVASIARRPVE